MAHKLQEAPDEVELEKMAQTELVRLKRQYRIMENDRGTCTGEAKLQLRNQTNMIDRLEYEKQELVLRIKIAASKLFARKDEDMEVKVKSLVTMRQKYEDLVKEEKQEIAELDHEIQKLLKEITAFKAKVKTDQQLKENAERQDQMIQIMENRLEVATKRFNVIVGDNTKLRKEIDDMLKQRMQFTNLWNKLLNQLNTGKQIINDLIEQSTIAFNQRDEELNKVQALRERGLRDLNSHIAEMCELQRTMDNEMKLQEFLGVKGQHREMTDLNEKRAAEKKVKMEEKQNKISSYRQILQMIKEFTGEQDIDKLISHFIKQEEENFALFSYVNELNDELDNLQSRMTQLTAAIEEAQAKNEQYTQQHSETLEKLKKRLEEQILRADAAEENLTQCDDVLEKLLKGIESLFKAIRCDNSQLLQLLGDNELITQGNVMLYLGIIEKRITQMFHKVYWLDRATKSQQLRLDEERRPRMKIPIIKSIAPTQPCALCIEKEELQIVSEGLEKPLTRDEATEKLKLRLEEDYSELMHNISGCHLPAARKVIQKRYQ